MTWLHDVALLATGIGAVYATARFLARHTRKRWIRTLGSYAIAVPVFWTLLPHLRGLLLVLFHLGLLVAVVADATDAELERAEEQRRRLRETAEAAERARRL